MDAEVREELDELRARIAALESFLADVEDAEVDPMMRVVEQHREFAASVQAKREQE